MPVRYAVRKSMPLIRLSTTRRFASDDRARMTANGV